MNKIAKADPVTGPLTREELAALVAAPYGEATKAIRKHDPFWGLEAGAKIEWKVRCRSNADGVAYIKAASQKEADALADDLTESDVDWGYDDDFEVLSVEPHIERR